MSYHIFKKTVNLCSLQKEKYQIKIKITKIGKNVMNIVRFSIALHYCIQNLHLLHFMIKVACICIPKRSCSCIEFSLKMRGPLKESISCLLIRLRPLVLLLIGFFYRTQSSLFYAFGGLKVLAFIFYRTQTPHLHRTQSPHFHRTQSPLSFTFRLRLLESLSLSRDNRVQWHAEINYGHPHTFAI